MNLGDTKQRGMKRNQASFKARPKSIYKYCAFKPELYCSPVMKFWSYTTLTWYIPGILKKRLKMTKSLITLSSTYVDIKN